MLHKVLIGAGVTATAILAVWELGYPVYTHFSKTSELQAFEKRATQKHQELETETRRGQYQARQYDYRANERYYREQKRRLRRENPGPPEQWQRSAQEEYRGVEEERQDARESWHEYQQQYQQQHD